MDSGIGTADEEEEGIDVDDQTLGFCVEETEWKDDEAEEVGGGRGGAVVVVDVAAGAVVVMTAVVLLGADDAGTETVTVTTVDTPEVGWTTEMAVLVTSTVAVATISVTVVVSAAVTVAVAPLSTFTTE